MTNANPGFVETVFQGVAAAWPADDRGPPQQLRPGGGPPRYGSRAGLVSDFFAAGLVSAAVNQHYGSEHAAQIEYAPLGERTGLCSALATTAYQNEGLTLQPCSTAGHDGVDRRYRRLARDRARPIPDRQRLDHGLHPPVSR